MIIRILLICQKKARANKKAIRKILEADLIVIGPGNYYCSIIPNLLVEDIPEAIIKSKAKVIFNCNLVNKKGHNEKFSLADYVNSINKYIGKDRINFVTFNTKKPDCRLVKKYESQKELLVNLGDISENKRRYKIIRSDILSNEKPKYSKADVLSSQRAFIRHDSEKLAKVLMMILELGDYENIIKEII